MTFIIYYEISLKNFHVISNVSMVESSGTAPESRMCPFRFNSYKIIYITRNLECQRES